MKAEKNRKRGAYTAGWDFSKFEAQKGFDSMGKIIGLLLCLNFYFWHAEFT